eukprot:1775104-Lingulodinium_polyedra.AAC.1
MGISRLSVSAAALHHHPSCSVSPSSSPTSRARHGFLLYPAAVFGSSDASGRPTRAPRGPL